MEEVNYDIFKFGLWTILSAGVFYEIRRFKNNPANFQM